MKLIEVFNVLSKSGTDWKSQEKYKNTFEGKSKEFKKCKQCEHSNMRFQANIIVSMPVSKDFFVSLANIYKTEIIDDCRCGSCN